MSASPTAKNSPKVNGRNGAVKKEESSSPPFWKFHSLPPSDVALALTKLDAVHNMMERIWQEEVALYEETMEIPGASRSQRRMKVPRRNYANAYGTVQDPRLFPYHTACYPLLDAYDALYPNGQGQPRLDSHAIPPSIHEADENIGSTVDNRRIMEEGEVPVPGYLGNSWKALLETFAGGEFGDQGEDLAEWRARLLSLNQVVDSARWIHVRQYQADPKFWEHQVFGDTTMILNNSNSQSHDRTNGLDAERHSSLSHEGERKFGLRYFPERSDDRFKILLRLLKHALSELQRDHRLAEMVLQCIIVAHGSDRIDVFQYLLIVLQSEYLLFCDGECHARAEGSVADRHRNGQGANEEEEEEDDDEEGGILPDHFCNDWFNFHSLIPLIIAGGVTWVTHDHANVLAAFVRRLYDAAGTPDPFFDPEPASTSSNPGAKQKLWLKRNLYYSRNSDWEDEEDDARVDDSGIPYELIRDLVLGLGVHAVLDIHTLKQLRDQVVEAGLNGREVESDLLDLIQQTANSFQNCVKALVDIGESTIRRIPINSRSYEMCGCLMRALVLAYIPSQGHTLDFSAECTYLSHLDSDLLKSIISPKRYADAITQATSRFLRQKEIASILNQTTVTSVSSTDRVQQTLTMLDAMLVSSPPEDVKDLVRSLVARKMVEIRNSGCGYGDFLVWCQLPVDAYDPLLFYHYFNYPAEQEGDDEDDEENNEEREDPSYQWESDEWEHQLTKREHWARYDFTLLALLRAWYAPWTRESHHSFSPAFRTAVRTLVLCANRIGAPVDIAAYVSQFLHRDWFVDERMQCWHEDCLNQNARSLYWRKFQQRGCTLSPGSRGPGKSKASTSLEYCPTCHVSMYCSPEHKQSDDKAGHKWCCGRPPWKAPLSSKEEELCLEVFSLIDSSKPDSSKETTTSKNRQHAEEINGDLQGETDGDDEDEEGSWESIDSNEDNQGSNSLTALISKFFEKKVYKHQGW